MTTEAPEQPATGPETQAQVVAPPRRGDTPSELELRWRTFRASIEAELPDLPMDRHLHHLNSRMIPLQI